MTCMEAQSKITPFISDQLTLEQAEVFIDHIKHCANCWEELEVYYALLTAMKQLDEDKELSDNYAQDLKKKIAGIEERIHRMRAARIRKRFLLFFIIASFGFYTSIQIGELVHDAQVPYTPKKHAFMLEYSGVPENYSLVQQFIKANDAGAKVYVGKVKDKRLRVRRFIVDKWNENGIFQFYYYLE